jgi:tRNA pseudouridine55 synthase
VDKPRGRTSHDVVARVRRVLSGAKVGHAGTLDPDATGVLVICVGKATKISSFLMESSKEYRGLGRLGVSTDTQDATGTVLEERPVSVAEDELRAACAAFVGEVEQVPPMYSAVKVDGQRLYRLARKGVEVERASRRVTVHELTVLDVAPPDFRFLLRCSKGTYVRTVVHDVGERLGCGAHLAELARTRQGIFGLEDALPWDALQAEDGPDRIVRAAVTPHEALGFLPALALPPSVAARRTGEIVPDGSDRPEGELVRLTDARGAVQGVGRTEERGVRILHLLPAVVLFGRGRRGA